MIVIDGKAHRNMPEQVAKNQKDIEEIFKTLDGLNIQDNVVAIADLSHMLTQDELKIVERAVAFIVYNNHLFIKRNQDATNAYFDIVFSINGSTVISFNSNEMQVNLTTGALTLVSNTAQTYSKTELDTQLALKANLSGANFTGSITAPSIIENMSGYSAELSTKTNLTIENIYTGAVKNGNKLTLVIALNLTRTGDVGSGQVISISIPSDVGAKLYPVNVGGNDILDAKKINALTTFYTGVNLSSFIGKASNTLLQLFIATGELNSNLELNTKYYYRYEATFLLSNNLAS